MKRAVLFLACWFVVSASAQEFVWALPAPVGVEVRQRVPAGAVLINYDRDGERVAFTGIGIDRYGQIFNHTLMAVGDSGIIRVRDTDEPQWDGNGNPIGGEIREAELESRYEGVPYYYSRRAYNADSFDGIQPFEKYIKRVSKTAYLDEPRVLGKLIEMCDLQVACLEEYRRRGLFQKETDILVVGFLGLYKEFRTQKVSSAVFTKDDSLSVNARGRQTTTWAEMKVRRR